jgi:hypothetical protein
MDDPTVIMNATKKTEAELVREAEEKFREEVDLKRKNDLGYSENIFMELNMVNL